MSSRFWLLQVQSRNFSQAEKERLCKLSNYFHTNGPGLSFSVKRVVIFELTQLKKNHVTQLTTM